MAHREVPEGFLHITFEHLERDDGFPGPASNPLEERSLEPVGVGAVVLLADHDDVGRCEVSDHGVEGHHAGARGVDHLMWRAILGGENAAAERHQRAGELANSES